MPCFKGLAVSIHTPSGPLPEYAIQKQARLSRITSYIPVPPPRITSGHTSEQSTFAISITLLTPGLGVPYSAPKSTPENPNPKPQVVGQLPGWGQEHGKYINGIGPYLPLTTSPNETVAAYIYFDGRQKEEVATLLRRGEETWVNSRWVGVPESEGGGLAEREFLFREVGLERWLNGLDLTGKEDAAARIERRRARVERKRRGKRKIKAEEDDDDDDDDGFFLWRSRADKYDKGVLRYGADAQSPLEKLSDEGEEDYSSEEDDSDDDPMPETTGQIKVALFRVLASGEIKKGEYSPQFDAHDDDDEFGKGAANGSGGEDGDNQADHTTSFAKPKALDPKSISTQTVTGIDGPEKPYAVFTFLYRGEKQLQKMGILKSKKPLVIEPAVKAKRQSMQDKLKELKPLKPSGIAGFSGVREPHLRNGDSIDPDEMDSDDDDETRTERMKKLVDEGGEFIKSSSLLSPEDASRSEGIADGVKKMRLKRQHSFEPSHPPQSATVSTPNPSSISTPIGPYAPTTNTPPDNPSNPEGPLLPSSTYNPDTERTKSQDESAASAAIIGSPLKKQRASMSGLDTEFRRSSADEVARGLGFGFLGKDQEGWSRPDGEKKDKSGANDGYLFGGLLPKPVDSGESNMSREGSGSRLVGTGSSVGVGNGGREIKEEDEEL